MVREGRGTGYKPVEYIANVKLKREYRALKSTQEGMQTDQESFEVDK